MAKDKRYTIVKNLITGGHITLFREIFDVIPKTVVLKDLKIHNIRFNELLIDVTGFYIEELYELAGFIDIDVMVLFSLINNQILEDKKFKRKKALPRP